MDFHIKYLGPFIAKNFEALQSSINLKNGRESVILLNNV